MTNPFRRQDVSSPTGEASESSVPMPRFGITSPTVAGPLSDASIRFPPAEDLSRAKLDSPSKEGDQGSIEELGTPEFGRKPPSLVLESSESKNVATSKSSLPPSPQVSRQRMSKAMDVESFKNLLMTGKADSAGSGTTVGSARESTNLDGESSSGTEPTSNVGFARRFEETPADDLESSSEFSDSDAEETIKATSPQRLVKGRPPPPPKSRHGKAIQKGPQTVSFDDFAPTIESTEPRSSRPEHHRMGSFTKPLPPTPQVPQVPKLSIPESPKHSESPEMIANENVPTPKKSAPPPPVARRSTITKRPRGNTASSMQSVTEEQQTPSRTSSVAESSSQSQSLKSPAPPPPPSRRMGSSSSIISPYPTPDATMTKPILETATNRSRSSSQVSLTTPPPAPPARRRSSRASLELTQRPNSGTLGSQSRRTSGEMTRSSLEGQRPQAPVAQSDQPIAEEVVENEEPSSSTASKKPQLAPLPSDDILADMEALQKEIDDLRAKYGNT